MTSTASAKFWLLKYGRVLYYGGILFLFLYIVLLIILLPLLFEGKDISSHVVIALASLVFVIILIIHSSFGYVSLSKVVRKLPAWFVIEDFDPVRMEVTIKDEKVRTYVIKFYRFLREPDIHDFMEDPEYYEVWTPIRRPSRYPKGDLYHRRDLRDFRLSSTLFDEKLRELSPHVSDELAKGLIPHIEEQAKAIPSLQFVRVVPGFEEPKLLAKLTKKADSAQMKQTLLLLRMLAREIEHVKSNY